MLQKMEGFKENEIVEIGRLVKLHGIVNELVSLIEDRLPARKNVASAVYRALRNTHTHTEYMTYIRQCAHTILKERNLLDAVSEAA